MGPGTLPVRQSEADGIEPAHRGSLRAPVLKTGEAEDLAGITSLVQGIRYQRGASAQRSNQTR